MIDINQQEVLNVALALPARQRAERRGRPRKLAAT